MLWGVVNFFFLPDSPMSAKRFTIEQKALLVGRSRLGQVLGVSIGTVDTYRLTW